MKFAVASDLHLGFGSMFVDKTEPAEVLILAGDVYEVEELKHQTPTSYVYESLKNLCDQFQQVVWVPGNHEHYGSNLYETTTNLKKWTQDNANDFGHVVVLNNESLHIGDVSIHGTTLWTDFKKGNPHIMHRAVNGMNDYNYIKRGHGVNIRAMDIMTEFSKAMAFLDGAVIKDHKNIVVTHHHPSTIGLDPRYIGNDLTFCYHSDLSEFILDRPEIKVWCSGHVHKRTDSMLGETRFICNPRGYRGHEPIARSFDLMYFEV